MTNFAFEFQLDKPQLDCNVSLDGDGFYVLFGSSGSGKTTLLNCIAGLIKPAAGKLQLNGENLEYIEPYYRQIGYVRQNSVLFPHLSVSENIQFPLKYVDSDQNHWLDMDEVIENTGISHLLDNCPSTLSGGERQRVALAQMLIRKPKLLLLDEPFSALDIESKKGLMNWLKVINHNYQLPVIYVTHDLYEVRFLKVKLLRLDNGEII